MICGTSGRGARYELAQRKVDYAALDYRVYYRRHRCGAFRVKWRRRGSCVDCSRAVRDLSDFVYRLSCLPRGTTSDGLVARERTKRFDRSLLKGAS